LSLSFFSTWWRLFCAGGSEAGRLKDSDVI
jgi:hypothetical protein